MKKAWIIPITKLFRFAAVLACLSLSGCEYFTEENTCINMARENKLWFPDQGWVPYDPQNMQFFVSNRFVRIEAGVDNNETKNDGLIRWVQSSEARTKPKLQETIDLCNTTSPYGLTGAVFARDRVAASTMCEQLRYAAGNFYINDKPTGAIVGLQPFGGSRASGTNDKAGGEFNLIRWISPRTIKETFQPATEYRYGYMIE